jgi:multisubunit Na+/H+ antiporter MnhC subunit
MQFFPFIVVGWILGIGLYGIVTSRHLIHQIVCLIVVQSSTYVLLLGVGYVTGAVAPYFYDVPVHTPAVDLAGIALLTPLGLAGAAVYVAGHGLVKAALFLCTGIVLHRLGSVNETWLHGRGRHLRVTRVVFTAAGLGLADLPPFGTFLGKGYIDTSAGARGLPRGRAGQVRSRPQDKDCWANTGGFGEGPQGPVRLVRLPG